MLDPRLLVLLEEGEVEGAEPWAGGCGNLVVDEVAVRAWCFIARYRKHSQDCIRTIIRTGALSNTAIVDMVKTKSLRKFRQQ
jgi:hypothetical protein